MANSLANQCWALAGIAQAATSVELAARGKALDEAPTLALYRALLEQDASSVQALAQLGDFSMGLQVAAGMLHKPDPEQIQALRYTLAILDATARLRKQPAAVKRLSEALGEIGQSEATDPHHIPQDMLWDIPWDKLAEIYVDTLGSLNQRVQVRGSQAILKRPDVANKIRALLLMGVRFAWLWHQLGGRRWHLLLNRRRMWQTTQLLAQLGHSGD